MGRAFSQISLKDKDRCRLEDGGLSWASQPMNRSSIEKPGLFCPHLKREREICSKILVLVASADNSGATNAQRQRQKRKEAVKRPLKQRIAKGSIVHQFSPHFLTHSLSLSSNLLSREGKKKRGGKGNSSPSDSCNCAATQEGTFNWQLPETFLLICDQIFRYAGLPFFPFLGKKIGMWSLLLSYSIGIRNLLSIIRSKCFC